MAVHRCRLSDGTANVDFNVAEPHQRPWLYEEDVVRAADGTEWRYQWWRKRTWQCDIHTMAKTDADQVNTWRRTNERLTFYPDYQDASATSYTVTIQNKYEPMQMRDSAGGWDRDFKGTIDLAEA